MSARFYLVETEEAECGASGGIWGADSQKSELDMLIEQRNLSALFQPILHMGKGEFYGYEGLIRGPANSPLHSPVNLFGAARQQGRSLEIEMLCRQVVLERFAEQQLPGKLFLNISPDTLLHPSFKNGQTLDYIRKLGLKPEQVVIEITENQPTFDFEAMRKALMHYRQMGFKIAMDDLGEGFSSLRMWSELRPEFVKIDMHFVQGVNADSLKHQFLKSIQQIAESCGTRVIAEGIETEEELMTVRDIGIALGQGYFIFRPCPVPPLVTQPEVGRIISSSMITVFPKNHILDSRQVTAQKLLTYIDPVTPETCNDVVFQRFTDNAALHALPVVQHGKPVGLINRYGFIDAFAQPFRRELLGKKSCVQMMKEQPLLVEKSTPIQEVSQFMTESDSRHFADGFIVTEEGRYLGMATGQDLLRAITQMQIEAARYSNPLTLLPGNVPINEHIERLLRAGSPFYACYCDLDSFKPYNDVYGYRKGDEMIQLTGRILRSVCDPKHDFLGHIGGDDFIVLMQSKDWQSRCEDALSAFAEVSAALALDEHRRIGGYESEDRQGKVVFHALPSLSIGAVRVDGGEFISHHEVSAAASLAKKMAKKIKGNSLFVEQRKNNVTVLRQEDAGLSAGGYSETVI
ncbi:MAG: GGDEF domain-containing protein [Pseudomonadota bacterium]